MTCFGAPLPVVIFAVLLIGLPMLGIAYRLGRLSMARETAEGRERA